MALTCGLEVAQRICKTWGEVLIKGACAAHRNVAAGKHFGFTTLLALNKHTKANIQVHKYTSTQVHKNINVQSHKYNFMHNPRQIRHVYSFISKYRHE